MADISAQQQAPPPPQPPPAASPRSATGPDGGDRAGGDTAAETPSWNNSSRRAGDSPFRVLGIALVVEEVGKGARLVFRYPSAPPPLSSAATAEAAARKTTNGDIISNGMAAHEDRVGGSGAATSPSAGAAASGLDPAARKQQQQQQEEESANLFFTLPDRTVVKLFRPKPPLCGQPMTLSVGGTVFCCRAVLLPPTSSGSGGSNQHQQQSGGQMQGAAAAQSPPKADSETEGNVATAAVAENSDVPSNSNTTTTTKAPKLVLFSVIVALSPVKGHARTFRESRYEGIATNPREAGTQEPHIYMSSPRRHMPASSPSGGGDHYEASSRSTSRRKKGHAGDGLNSASFLAIRRAHVSLSRFCRVLEREERRCSYVSSQSAAFVKIRSEIKDGEGSSTTRRGSGGGGDAAPSPGSTATKPVDPGGEAKPVRPRHVRMGSNATAISIPQTPMSLSIADRGVSTDTRISVEIGGAASNGGNSRRVGVDQKLERVSKQEESSQAIIELMFAYNTGGDGRSSNVLGGHHDRLSLIHGNLARELAQVFHSLSRNDGNAVSFPTPSSLLSSRDGIVYINRHLAVPIEPVSGFRNFKGFPFGPNGSPSAFDLHASTPQTVVRPYHTLLFPHAPPAELAKAMSDERSPKDGGGGLDGAQGTSVPPAASSHNQRLQRLLLMANPSKSLADIAVDAALSIPVTLQLASYLVESGTCTLAHVATRSARYAVSPSGGVERIRSLALPFSQRFGRAVPIFHAVAALTSSGQTLGEILSSASSATDGVGIGNLIASMKKESRIARRDRQQRTNAAVMSRPRGGSYGNETFYSPTGPGQAAETGTSVSADEVDDVLYEMTLWLRAHSVIIELRDYLTKIKATSVNLPTTEGSSPTPVTEAHASKSHTSTVTAEDTTRGDKALSAPKVKTMTTEEFLASSVWNDSQAMHNASGRPLDGREGNISKEEAIFEELDEVGDCLSGNVSTVALSWKYGLDVWRLVKLKEWGRSEGKLEVIRRVPYPGDDWGAP